MLARGDRQAVPHGHPLELMTLPQVAADHLTRSDFLPHVHWRQEAASVSLDRQDAVILIHTYAHEPLLSWLWRLLRLLFLLVLLPLLLLLLWCRVGRVWHKVLVVSEDVDLQVAFEKNRGAVRTFRPSLGRS